MTDNLERESMPQLDANERILIRHSKYDAVTLPQKSRIMGELLRLKPSLPYDDEDPWIAELNARLNLNLASLDELSKQEASKIISQLTTP
jgi:hypothetical protein